MCNLNRPVSNKWPLLITTWKCVYFYINKFISSHVCASFGPNLNHYDIMTLLGNKYKNFHSTYVVFNSFMSNIALNRDSCWAIFSFQTLRTQFHNFLMWSIFRCFYFLWIWRSNLCAFLGKHMFWMGQCLIWVRTHVQPETDV